MCASSYCGKRKVTFLWGVRYFAFAGGKSMDAGNYCRRADSPQALTLVTSSCAHDIGEISSYLQPGTWSKLAIEVLSIVNGVREAPKSSPSPSSWWDFHPFWSQVFGKSWTLQLYRCNQHNTPHHTHSAFTEVAPVTRIPLCNTQPCGRPAVYLELTALNMLCNAICVLFPTGPWPVPGGTALRDFSLPIDSGRTRKTTVTEWGSSFTKMWEWEQATDCMDALGWYKWAVDTRLTLPLKCSAGSTAYGDREQGAAQ